MNEKDDKGLVLAVGGISLAWLVFFASQIRVLSLETATLEEQYKAVTQQVESAKATEAHTDEALQKREALIRHSQESEVRYSEFFEELIELARVDPDARFITQKWRIQSNQPSAHGGAEPSLPDQPRALQLDLKDVRSPRPFIAPKPLR